MYLKEQKKKYKQSKFNSDNWQYDKATDTYTCPYQKRLRFTCQSVRNDRIGFQRTLNIYECEDCSGCPFRSSCTKAKEGNNRKIMVNEDVRAKLSEEKSNAVYRKRKIDVEPVLGFLKANLRFTRFSVRGKPKVENEIGLALMAVNLRKYIAINQAIR